MATEEVAANINISNENGFIAFFRSMPKCDDEVVRLFNRGDFYSIHGDQAVMVANNFLNTSQALRSIGPEGNKLYSVAISQSRFDSFIRFLLVDNNYRLEIYKKPSGKNQSEYSWFLDLKASPGCLGQLEELLYNVNVSSALNQNIAAINLDSDSKVHFALISVTDCTIYVGSFDDNSSYTLLESLLVRLNPKECLIPHNMNMDRIKMMLRKNNILFSKYDDSSSINSSDESESMISKLLKNEYKMTLSTILQESRNILVPIQALVNYLDLMKDRFCYSNYHLKLIESETFVRLDLSSISNLHLFPKNRSQKEIHSLFQVLNHCKTISGQKLLDSFIRQPLTDLAAIEQRLDNVEFFRNNLIITSAFYEHFLAKIPDITKVYKKLTNGRCKLKDLYQVYCVVEELPMMINTFEEKSIPSSIRETIFDIIKEVHEKLEPFKRLALKWIDFSRYNESKELWINSNIDDDLKKFKSKIDKLYDASKKELESVRQDLYRSFDVDKEKVKLEEDKFGFYFRITKKCSNAVFQSKKYKEIRSTTKDSKFFSKNLNDINEEFVEYIGKYNELQQVYIEKFVEQARQYMDSILKLEQVLAYTDVMISLSKASQKTTKHYNRPKLLPKGSKKIILKQFRHPIIEILKDLDFVSNDVAFDQYKFFVVTGPNMGGKSTFIRSVAICVLMAQIGSFVPCDEAEISIVDAIYTRISASDNPMLGLSTFMSEMVEASAIIRSATENSLIVIDELGRSTGTFDGFGIAHGITKHLAESTQAFALFATHFHHLGMELDKVGRLAMRCSFENGQLLNHFQAEIGTSEKSFGIELARRANISENVVARAQEKLNKLQNSFANSDYVNRLICLLKKEMKNDSSVIVNNDPISYQQYLKDQIHKKLLDIDWTKIMKS